MDNLQLFGKRIRELRKLKGLTQEQPAETAGLDVKQISNLETGNCFTTMQTIEKLADCFSCEIFQLFNFAHLKPKDDLIPVLNKKILRAEEKDVQLIAKLISCVLED